jgi:hypothetical protein
MADNNLPAKRKRTLNPKLTSEDNVHHEAIRRRQELQSQTKTSGTIGHSSRQASVEAVDDPEDRVRHNVGRPKNPNLIPEATDDEDDMEDEASQQAAKRRKEKHVHTKTSGTASHSSHQASVKAVDDPEDHIRHNAGRPKNPSLIIEDTDDESNIGYQHAIKRRKEKHVHTKTSGTAGHSSRQASVEAVDDPEDHIRRNVGRPKNPKSILEATDDEEDAELQEETDEQELGKCTIHTILDTSSRLSSLPPEGLAVTNLCILST